MEITPLTGSAVARTLSRRSVVRAGAWGAPAIVVVSASPALAVSTDPAYGGMTLLDGWDNSVDTSSHSIPTAGNGNRRYRLRFRIENTGSGNAAVSVTYQVVVTPDLQLEVGQENALGTTTGATDPNFSWDPGVSASGQMVFTKVDAVGAGEINKFKLDLVRATANGPAPTSVTVTATIANNPTAGTWRQTVLGPISLALQ